MRPTRFSILRQAPRQIFHEYFHVFGIDNRVIGNDSEVFEKLVYLSTPRKTALPGSVESPAPDPEHLLICKKLPR